MERWHNDVSLFIYPKITDDVGVVGSLFAMPAFKSTMYGTETPDPVKFAFDQGWIVSFFALGAAVGAFVNGWLSDAIGRKKTVIVGAVLFLLGGGLQAGAMSIPMLYVGRCLAGLSIGSLSVSRGVWFFCTVLC